MKKWSILFGVLALFAGCQKYYISISQDKIDVNYLASSHVGTPDPRQKNPPIGERLVIEWNVPVEVIKEEATLHLQVIYKDYSQSFFTYPMPYRLDYVVYTLQGEEYKEKRGILTYKAEVVKKDGSIFRQWKHQLWAELVIIDEPTSSDVFFDEEEQFYEEEPSKEESSAFEASSTSFSVSSQSIQGSVIDKEGLDEELKD